MFTRATQWSMDQVGWFVRSSCACTELHPFGLGPLQPWQECTIDPETIINNNWLCWLPITNSLGQHKSKQSRLSPSYCSVDWVVCSIECGLASNHLMARCLVHWVRPLIAIDNTVHWSSSASNNVLQLNSSVPTRVVLIYSRALVPNAWVNHTTFRWNGF